MKPYEKLGVSPNAPQAEITKAYMRLRSRFHPDHGGNITTYLEIQAAYRMMCKSANSSNDKMEELFTGMLTQTLDIQGDAISSFKHMIKGNIRALDGQIDKLKTEIVTVKRRRERLVTDNVGNLAHRLADNLVFSLEEQIEIKRVEIEALELTAERLDDYRDSELLQS